MKKTLGDTHNEGSRALRVQMKKKMTLGEKEGEGGDGHEKERLGPRPVCAKKEE